MFFVIITYAGKKAVQTWLTQRELNQYVKDWAKDETIVTIKIRRTETGVLEEVTE